jgi:dipeptidase D
MNMSVKVSNQSINSINKRVFYYFKEISRIPHGSGNEMSIADYLSAFAEERGLKKKRSTAIVNGKQTHNVVICKPASSECYQKLETVVLQAHIDMVCQKTKDSTHDFEKDPIQLVIEEETGKMTAKDTTLGADDGIGVACILAILENNQIEHPPIEALFTSDEEEGMTGAIAVDRELITGRRLINIDTETEGILYNGCAGSINADFRLPITYEPIPAGYLFFKIEISGLLGGHSGIEIHKRHANAHKLLARTLRAIMDSLPLCLISFEGGNKRNAITREACARIAIPEGKDFDISGLVLKWQDVFIHEYDGIEPSIKMSIAPILSDDQQALSSESANKLVDAILIMPNDIQAMHAKIEGLVETSCNLGIVSQESNQILLCSLIRSFIRTKKMYVFEQMNRIADMIGAELIAGSDTPDWEPNADSDLKKRFIHAYITAFSKEPKIESIHAGLECGYFSRKFPDMDIIACGPTITGAHTTEETLDIHSMKRVTELLLHVLNQMDSEVM